MSVYFGFEHAVAVLTMDRHAGEGACHADLATLSAGLVLIPGLDDLMKKSISICLVVVIRLGKMKKQVHASVMNFG